MTSIDRPLRRPYAIPRALRPAIAVPRALRPETVAAETRKIKLVQQKSPDFFTDLFQTVYKALSDMTILIVVGIVGFIMFTHLDNEDSPVLKGLANLKNFNSNFAPLVEFIITKIKFFEAVAIFVPVIIAVPQSKRTMCVVIVFLWLLTSSFTVLQYTVQAVTLFLFFKLKSPGHKIVIVMLCIFLFYYLSPSVSPSGKTEPIRENNLESERLMQQQFQNQRDAQAILKSQERLQQERAMFERQQQDAIDRQQQAAEHQRILDERARRTHQQQINPNQPQPQNQEHPMYNQF